MQKMAHFKKNQQGALALFGAKSVERKQAGENKFKQSIEEII